jgi:hypothetical protein
MLLLSEAITTRSLCAPDAPASIVRRRVDPVEAESGSDPGAVDILEMSSSI